MIRPLLLAASLFAAAPTFAETTTVGDLHIERAVLRDTAPNAPVAAGFLVIENTGEADDVLVAAEVDADFVADMELHEMVMEEGVMRMSEVEGGIAIPAGETVILRPGGLHLMLMGLTGPLVAGDSHAVTLTFEAAGAVTMDFPVLTLGEIRESFAAASADHGGQGAEAGNSGHGN